MGIEELETEITNRVETIDFRGTKLKVINVDLVLDLIDQWQTPISKDEGCDEGWNIPEETFVMEEPTQPELVEVPELQFPQSVVDWLETPTEENHDELLSYIMRYYWNEDSAYDDTIPSEVGEYLAESLSNVVKLLRAMEGESYTVKKEQLYYVKVGNLVFAGWEDSFIAKFTKTDNIGWTDYAHKITTKDAAVEVAKIVGGYAVPVGEEELWITLPL